MSDDVEEDRSLAQPQTIFDRGLPTEDRETVVAFLTELLVKGLDTGFGDRRGASPTDSA